MKSDPQPRSCPYLHANDDRCGKVLTLERLADAFRYCVGRPSDCPIYHQIRIERGTGRNIAAAG